MDDVSGFEVLVKHGRGILKWPDGAMYDGEWHENTMQGQGTFKHSNGDIHLGEFSSCRANGFGSYS